MVEADEKPIPAWREEFDRQMQDIERKLNTSEKKIEKERNAARADFHRELENLRSKLRGEKPSGKQPGFLESLVGGIGEFTESVSGTLGNLGDTFTLFGEKYNLLQKYAIPLWREYPDEFRRYVVDFPDLQDDLEKQLEAEAITRKLAGALEDKTKFLPPVEEIRKKRTLSEKVDYFVEEREKIRARLKDDPEFAEELIAELKRLIFEGEE